MSNRFNAETLLYWFILGTLALSMSGFPSIRYAVYLLPVIAVVLWAAKGEYRLHLCPETIPFLFLLVLMLLTVPQATETGFKRVYFVSAYTSLFVLFDMRRAYINYWLLSAVLLLLFLFSLYVTRDARVFSNLDISIIDSKSEAESTFSFVFGLLSVYFLLSRNYLLSTLNAIFSIIALKRIVLVGLLVVLVVWLLPRRLRRALLSPVLVTTIFVVALIACVMFAQGAFDETIKSSIGHSSNALSMGRRELWALAMKLADYDPISVLFWGAGVGTVQGSIQEYFSAHRGGLLHNDLLTLVLEQGWIATAVFVYFVANQKTNESRALALFLLIIFLTDNVIIYQHVMIMYMLLVARAGRPPVAQKTDASRVRRRFPNILTSAQMKR